MKISSVAASAAVSVWLAISPVAAQQLGVRSEPALHGVNPSLSLSAPTSNPVQAQIREDYRISLSGAQRDLLQQNPSGLGRQELTIGHELNGYARPQ
jgi:hypothetical protein